LGNCSQGSVAAPEGFLAGLSTLVVFACGLNCFVESAAAPDGFLFAFLSFLMDQVQTISMQ
jgi:hypothetical protein